jgi:transcriptional regulator with XRE-family HTH domain
MQDAEYAAEYRRTQPFADLTMQLIRYRTEAGVTQAALARKLKTTQSVISRLESFEYTGMKLETLLNYANALDLDVQIVLQPSHCRHVAVASSA